MTSGVFNKFHMLIDFIRLAEWVQTKCEWTGLSWSFEMSTVFLLIINNNKLRYSKFFLVKSL